MSEILAYREQVKRTGCNIPVTKEMAVALHKEERLVHTSIWPNRRKRRESIRKDRFRSNKKGVSLSIHKNMKYNRVVQMIGSKRIEHYIPVKS